MDYLSIFLSHLISFPSNSAAEEEEKEEEFSPLCTMEISRRNDHAALYGRTWGDSSSACIYPSRPPLTC